MNIGQMRHRITIQKKEIVKDSENYLMEQWTDFTKCWAKAENVSMVELFSSDAVQIEKNLLFTIHFRRELTQDMRIVFRNAFYEITGIDNEKYQNKYLILQTERIEPESGATSG